MSGSKPKLSVKSWSVRGLSSKNSQTPAPSPPRSRSTAPPPAPPPQSRPPSEQPPKSSSSASSKPQQQQKQSRTTSPAVTTSKTTGNLRAPTELGLSPRQSTGGGNEGGSTPATPPALRHLRPHPRIVQTRRRAKLAVHRLLTPAAIEEERDIYTKYIDEDSYTGQTFCRAFCYRGMEVIVATTQTEAYVVCSRTRFVLQTLDVAGPTESTSEDTIISLRTHASTGQIVICTRSGRLSTYYPKPSDVRLVNFGKYRWHTGPVAQCSQIFYSKSTATTGPKKFNSNAGGGGHVFAPARHKRGGLEVSLANQFLVLVAHRNQLAVLDVNPQLPSSLSVEDGAAAAVSRAELLWTTCLPSRIVTAQMSGDAQSIAVVLEPSTTQDHDAADSDGVYTLERDWEDGGTNSHNTKIGAEPLEKQGSTVSRRRSSSVGILYKPGPFLVHSAPVIRVSFRGLGQETSQPPNGIDNMQLEDFPGNDLLLTVSKDNVAQIFGQSNWKPLTEWTMSPKTRVDWVSGSAAMTLGDLEGRTSGKSKKPSRSMSESDLAGMERAEALNESLTHRHSHFLSIPTHATPISKAGAWICEICCGEGGPFPSIRLSRLTYLKRGADDLSPTLFESVSGYLPSNAIFDQSVLGLAEDPATLTVEGLWPAWNPYVGDAVGSNNDAPGATNETLRGSAMAFLGLSSAYHPIGVGGAFQDPQLVGTQCPPLDLRLTVAHPISGHVAVLEYPLYGERSLTSLELGRPTHSVLALNELGMGRDDLATDSNRTSAEETSLDHGNGRLVAKLDHTGTVRLTWRQPGTFTILPSSWLGDDVYRDDVTDLLSNTKRLRDESLVAAPLVLRPLRLPKDMAEDPIKTILWWPDSKVTGAPPVLLAITKSGRAVAFEVVTPLVAVTGETDAISVPVFGSSPGELRHRTSLTLDDDMGDQLTPEYEVSIVPDPELGLGLRLESLDDGQPAIAGSFKKNPVTGCNLPAERSGMITLGDELISANGILLEDKTFDEIIANVRELGASSGPGHPIRLRFRRKQPGMGRSRSGSAGSDLSNRRSMEQIIGVSPDSFQQRKVIRTGSYESGQNSSTAPKFMNFGSSAGASQIIASFLNPIPGVAGAVASADPRRKLSLLPHDEGKLVVDESTAILCCAEGNEIVFSKLSVPNDGRSITSEFSKIYSCQAGDVEVESIQFLYVDRTSYFIIVLEISGRVRLAVANIDIEANKYTATFFDVAKLEAKNPASVEIRSHSVEMFATLDTTYSSQDPLLIWSAKLHPGCKLQQLVREDSTKRDIPDFTSFPVRLEGGTNSMTISNRITDFAFASTGSLDSAPWLLVFDTQGLTVHHRPGGSDEWIPLSYVYYTTLPGSSSMSSCEEDFVSGAICAGKRPRDLFPHLLQAVRASLPSSDEINFLCSDWHPEALLANLCIGRNGVDHSLRNRVRDLYLWLCSEGTNIEEDQANSPLLCAPLDTEEKKNHPGATASRSAENVMDALMVKVEPNGSPEEVFMLEKFQKILVAASNDRMLREKLKPDSCSVLELPPMLQSCSADDLMLLWGIGELLLNPPDFHSADVQGQLFIFSATLDEIMRNELESKKADKADKYVAPSVLRRDASARIPQSESIGPGPLVASGACLSALMSNSQERILGWVKKNFTPMDWETARRLRIPFWVRSDKSLARISEEIGQAVFREKRDVMQCALFFIIARKIRTLRNLAATDQSPCGKKFFTFLTTHDFSSERGRRAAEKNAFSLLRKCRYQVAAAFFLLAEPPSLNTALETIVTKMHDLDLAFMVARLMESNELEPGGGVLSLVGGFGGGRGYAGLSGVVEASVGMDEVKFQQWSPSPGKNTKKLIVDRVFQKSANDSAMCALVLLWMNKKEEASWWLPGFIALSPGSESGFKLVDDLERRLSKKLKGREDHSRLGSIEKANGIIDFASVPLLQKTMKSSFRSRYAGTLLVSNQLISRGIEIPSMWSLLVYLENESDIPDKGRTDNPNEGPVSDTRSIKFSIFDSFDVPPAAQKKPVAAPESSIFDSFDVPPQPTRIKPSPQLKSSVFDSFGIPAAKPPPHVQSSIFDAFDVPSTKPAKPLLSQGEMESSIFDNFNFSSATASATDKGSARFSIFDSYDTPNLPINGNSAKGAGGAPAISNSHEVPEAQTSQPATPKPGTAETDTAPGHDIHLSLSKTPVPAIWSVWKERVIVLGVARRLLREVASIFANFHGDPAVVSVEDFFHQKHPVLPSGASAVLQVRCEADGILARVKESLRDLSAASNTDVLTAVNAAVGLLGGHSHFCRIVFSVVLYAAIERFDLAESLLRVAANSLILQTKAFGLALDDVCDRRQTRYQVGSVQARRLAARVSWQLETCLWLHRSGGIPLSGLAFKETTIAVRLGVLLATWNRDPAAIEAILRCEPDTIVDEEEGAVLWSSLKQTSDNLGDKRKKTSSGGWEFFVNCRRSEATKILRECPTGSFIIRPHPNDSGVFTLSFKTNLVPGEEPGIIADDTQDAEEGTDAEGRSGRSAGKAIKKDDIVQHAIIRLSDSGFRCGSFGPFTSLLDLLESVSESLPFHLRFDLPPTNRVIREEGSQPSPNAALFRKLTLTHASSMASSPIHESVGCAHHSTPSVARVRPSERLSSFGVFLDLLILSKIRRQLSGIAVVAYEGSTLAGDERQTNFVGDVDNICPVAHWIMGPLLGWCRSLEVRGVVELCPPISLLWSTLPQQSQQSQATLDASEQSVEVTLDPKIAQTAYSGDSILRSMIQRDSGVDFSTLRLVDGGECSMVVLFSKPEALKWLVSSGTEQTESDAIHRLERMEKDRVIEPVDFSKLQLKHRPADLEDGIRYRFVDPWEVEAVGSREGETRSASLGRQHFLGFSLGTIALACESDFRVLGGIPLLELWMNTKGGVVLSRALAAVHPPWERGAGGDLQVRGGVVAEPEPFSNSIRQHLYRNALFRRLELPQRFLALVQVELLDLKNLTSPSGSLSLSVYALLRLKRRGSSGVLSNKTRTLDTASTGPVRLGKPTGVGPNAPASWGSVVRFRYPLPDDIAIDGTSFDTDREALFKGPPSVLQITVYEKKLLVDHALGTADVDMDGLLAGGQVEEWVPLRSDKHGIHWFTRIRITLRFELMCLASRELKDLCSAAPSVGLQRIQTLCQTGGTAAHEDHKRSISSPDLLQYLESMVY